MYKFTLPVYGVYKSGAASLNVYRNAHYHKNNQAKKKFKSLIHDQLIKFDPIEGQLKFKYIYFARRKDSDLSNVCAVIIKFFEDSLVEYGLIPDDNVQIVVSIKQEFGGMDRKKPRVECEIEQVMI